MAGKRASPWISTSKSFDVASNKYDTGYGVVEIDLSKVISEIVDISTGAGLKGRMKAYAISDLEVLIRDFIPAEAIRRIK